MSYTKNTWANGDTITAAKLNNMENGIEAAEQSGGGYDIVFVCDKDVANASTITYSDFNVASGSLEACEQKLANGEPISAVLHFVYAYGSNTTNECREYQCYLCSVAYRQYCFRTQVDGHGSRQTCIISYNSSYQISHVDFQ